MDDVEVYTQEELRAALSILLAFIDKNAPEGMHFMGQSPDWFVGAAMMACNIKERKRGDAIECLEDWAKEWNN